MRLPPKQEELPGGGFSRIAPPEIAETLPKPFHIGIPCYLSEDGSQAHHGEVPVGFGNDGQARDFVSQTAKFLSEPFPEAGDCPRGNGGVEDHPIRIETANELCHCGALQLGEPLLIDFSGVYHPHPGVLNQGEELSQKRFSPFSGNRFRIGRSQGPQAVLGVSFHEDPSYNHRAE